jgi:hypothetical protein
VNNVSTFNPVKSLKLSSEQGIQRFVWVALVFVTAACLFRYLKFPSFWLDEAFVATSLRDPSIHTIFGSLENKQFFPRVYLYAIVILRDLFGYRIWVLRLLPFSCFIVGSWLWARLLMKKANDVLMIGLPGAVGKNGGQN